MEADEDLKPPAKMGTSRPVPFNFCGYRSKFAGSAG